MHDSLYGDPSWYMTVFQERHHDVLHYVTLANELGEMANILELGVGTGRVAIPVAQAGHRVVGVDRSESMIAAFMAACETLEPAIRSRLEHEVADASSFEAPRAFDAVFCPFNGIAHCHQKEDLSQLLENALRLCRPGGLVAFDFIKRERSRMEGGVVEVPWLEDPRTGLPARCTETTSYDEESEILHVQSEIRPMKGPESPRRLDLYLRLWCPADVREVLSTLPGHSRCEEIDLGDSHALIVYRSTISDE